MSSPAKTLLIIAALVLLGATASSAADQPLENRILTPLGSPSAPVHLKVPTSNENYPSPTAARPLPALPITNWITFQDFMRLVEEQNLLLAAQRYNVPIAEAHLIASHVYPDPAFQAGYGGDVSNERQATTYNGQLTATIVLGGRLRYGVQVASASLGASRAGLADYLRTLR